MHVRLDAGSRLIRIVVEGANRVSGHRLRIHFPVRAAVAGCLADMPYGPVWRGMAAPAGPAAMEQPVRTAPMHRYVSLPGGPTVFARGLFEYELTEEGTVAITLFRAVSQLSRGGLRARPGHAAWPQAIPDAALIGPFRAELAVSLTGACPDAVADLTRLEALAEEFHAPLAGLMVPDAVDPPGSLPGPRLDGAGLAFTALKPCSDGRGMVLRCVNVTQRPVEGAWQLPAPCRRAERSRLDERAVETIVVEQGGRRIPFRAGRREVVTIRVEW
jgi:alpha-mannosidase